jgi:hypothetical protein
LKYFQSVGKSEPEKKRWMNFSFVMFGKVCQKQENENKFTLSRLLIEVSKVVEAAAKVSLATVYQKHSSLRNRKMMYRG